MKFIRLATLVMVSAVTSHVSLSQENFLSGYVVNTAGDTISGEVDYRNWSKNPQKIAFKSKDGVVNDLTPQQTQLVVVADERYVGAKVNLSERYKGIDVMDRSSEPNVTSNWVFLQTLYRGEKSLYYYHNGFFNDFYITSDNEFVHLIQKKYVAQGENGRNRMAENRRFVGQLAYYLNAYPKVTVKLDGIEFNREALVSLFEAYGEWNGEIQPYLKTKEPTQYRFGVLAGASITKLEFIAYSSNFDYLKALNNRTSYDPSIGISLDIILPRNAKKWSFRNEILFSTFQIKDARYNSSSSGSDFRNFYTSLGLTYIKHNLMLRYSLPIGGVQVFANVGVANGWVIDERVNKRIEKLKFFDSENQYEQVAMEKLRKYEQTLVAGVGAHRGHMSIETRAEYGNGMSPYTSLRSDTKRFFFLLGYFF